MKLSYLSQVKILRCLANEALKRYPIKVKNIKLMRYAANAVYKVTDTKGKQYQVRIQPEAWHTQKAIQEEVKWLNYILQTTDIRVPRPIPNTDNQFITRCQHAKNASERFLEVFDWLPGKKRWCSINAEYAKNVGEIAAKLHTSGQKMTVKHRNYWDVESMVGTTSPRFVNMDKLEGVSAKQQATITVIRKDVCQQLKEYEKNNKDKMGLIHGDLQPNNILVANKQLGVIDFDDCGTGFYAYELATSLHAFHQLAQNKGHKSYLLLKNALLEGYAKYMPLTQIDINYLPYFILALRLVTIGWLNKNRQNTKAYSYFNEAINDLVKYFKAVENGKAV